MDVLRKRSLSINTWSGGDLHLLLYGVIVEIRVLVAFKIHLVYLFERRRNKEG